ncbi:hypothetical protein [Xanthomonas arboricola]|uniref:hypothetical protein n=1 Tax=Xanthomonas arboricola TaxID=56448 RepID=UPI0012698023|nr:hypothetical protein [Xanthomonas arboricola]
MKNYFSHFNLLRAAVVALILFTVAGFYYYFGRASRLSSDVLSPPVAAIIKDGSRTPRVLNGGGFSASLSKEGKLSESARAYALCKRAEELQNCADAERLLGGVEVSNPHKFQGLDKAEQILALTKRCEEMPYLDTKGIIRHWRQAAEEGSFSAKRYYVLAKPFRTGDVIDTLGELELYKKNAQAYAFELAKAGDVPTLFALADAYYPASAEYQGRSLLSQVMKEKDLNKSLYIYLRLQESLEKMGKSVPIQIGVRINNLKKMIPQYSDNEVAVEFLSWNQPDVIGYGRAARGLCD